MYLINTNQNDRNNKAALSATLDPLVQRWNDPHLTQLWRFIHTNNYPHPSLVLSPNSAPTSLALSHWLVHWTGVLLRLGANDNNFFTRLLLRPSSFANSLLPSMTEGFAITPEIAAAAGFTAVYQCPCGEQYGGNIKILTLFNNHQCTVYHTLTLPVSSTLFPSHRFL